MTDKAAQIPTNGHHRLKAVGDAMTDKAAQIPNYGLAVEPESPIRVVREHQVVIHGVEGEEGFQLFGADLTPYEDFATGAGPDAAQAFEQAAALLAAKGWQLPETWDDKPAPDALRSTTEGRVLVSVHVR